MKYVILFLLFTSLARAADTAYEYGINVNGDLVVSAETNSWILIVHGTGTNDFQRDVAEETLDYAEQLLDCRAISAAIAQCIKAQRIMNDHIIVLEDKQ